MRDFFFGIKSFFEAILLDPLDSIRHYQDENWWVATTPVWLMICVLFVYFFYWLSQLNKFDKKGKERKDVTAHSFFKN